MKEITKEATVLRPERHRAMDVQLLAFDLSSLTKQILKEKAWKKSDRNAITIFKTDGMRIVLIAMHKDAKMIRHMVNGMISLQVLKGKIQFDTDNRSEELGEGQMLTLHESIPHSVLAKKKTVFLLTLTTTLAGKEIK
jgi:quercetin dioxygenase-like cupin family protein